MFGKGYVIEHCISLFSKKQIEKAYRIYVTDCLKAIAENTTHLMSFEGVIDVGSHMESRFADIIDFEKKKKIEEFEKKSTNQIVDEIWNGMKGGKKH